MERLDGLEVVTATDAAGWEAWVAGHHADAPGAWLKIAKKGAAVASVTLAEAADICLCFGWIDSVRRALDETYYLQRYSHRRSTSSWSKVNVARAERLAAAGHMHANGLAEIAAAKADGRWDCAYESQKNSTTPPDLAAALARSAESRAIYDSLCRSDRYAVILPLLKSRTPTIRAARLSKVLADLESPRLIAG